MRSRAIRPLDLDHTCRTCLVSFIELVDTFGSEIGGRGPRRPGSPSLSSLTPRLIASLPR
ncbi:unnamed protein product [Prunus armeniaca]